MRYFIKTAVSAKMLGKALKARTTYIDEAMKILKYENPELGKKLLQHNKSQIERMADSAFAKGWGGAVDLSKAKTPREALSIARKVVRGPSDQFKELNRAKKALESKELWPK